MSNYTSKRLTPRQQRLIEASQRKHLEQVEMLVTSIDDNTASFQTLEEIYEHISEPKAASLLQLRDWFTFVCVFDPLSCEPEVTGTDELLQRIREYKDVNKMRDRLGRVLKHSLEALKNILLEMRTQIIREHSKLPIYAVQEVDSASIQWLSRKTGRTIREKLSGNPYLLAVHKRMSADTSENRLLKMFINRLEPLLLTRIETKQQDEYADAIEEILGLIQQWKNSDDYTGIGEWKNPPPNNTLLENRNYRKILDAWNWLSTIDDDVAKDFERMNCDTTTMLIWRILAELSDLQNVRILQFPVQPQYDNFSFGNLTGVIGINLATNENITYQKEKDNIIIRCGQNEKTFSLESKVKVPDVFLSSDIITSTHIKKLLRITELKRASAKTFQEFSGKHCAIDLCSIRPLFMIDKKAEINLPFRFLTQHHVTQDDEYLLDCKNSEAVMLRHDNVTIGMSELFFNKTDFPPAKKSQSAKLFCQILREHIKTETLTYLLPDCIDDFEIETLRKSINFYFPNAEPLPRSIAAVLAWQALPTFQKYGIKKGNTILIMEDAGQHFTLTKIECKYNPQLKKDIPQTLGFYWERHPVIEFDSPFFSVVKKIFAESSSVEIADVLLNLFQPEDLIAESDKLSFYSTDLLQWIHTPSLKEWREKLKSHFTSQSFQQFDKQFSKAIKNLRGFIYFFQIGSPLFRLPQDFLKFQYTRNIFFNDSILHGATILQNWQEQTEEPIWKDHLPNLSIVIPFQNDFPLVHNETLVPQRKKKIQIAVKNNFELPKGQKEYHFGLKQGEGKTRQQFEAFLQHKLFPLQDNVTCRLDLSYTYGADAPYELRFIPFDVNQAEFDFVKVKWQSKVDVPIDLDILPIPPFPEKIAPQPRVADKIIDLRQDKNGCDYFLTENNIRLYQNSFVCGLNFNNFCGGTHITYIPTQTNKRTNEIIKASQAKECISSKTARQLLESKDMPIIKIYRWDIAVAINNAETESQQKLFQHLLQILSESKDNFDHHHILWILSIALWRSEKLILRPEFSAEQIIAVLQVLKNRINWAISLKERTDKDGKEERNIKSKILTSYLEFLLAILRTRTSNNKEIKEILAPNKKRTNDFIELLKKIRELKLPIRSRISLQVDQPEQFRDVPNLLYAVQMYLTGDTGADTIRILQVKDED
jgi:hypothetical protein